MKQNICSDVKPLLLRLWMYKFMWTVIHKNVAVDL